MKAMGGSRVPSLTLPDVVSGAAVNLRSGRGPLVLLTVHAPGCRDCVRLVEEIATAADRVGEWGGQVIVAVPGEPGRDWAGEEVEALRRAAGASIQVLADPAGQVTGSAARVMIADEWGEIYYRAEAGSDHALPTPAEVVEWVRFIGIQCPECEGPEGEWRRIQEGARPAR